MTRPNLPVGILRKLLRDAGALIDETTSVSELENMRFHGGESNRHKIWKIMTAIAARDLDYYAFLEVPVHGGIVDVLILPPPVYVQIEYCNSATEKSNYIQSYYDRFQCRVYDAELFVLDYSCLPYEKHEWEHWHKAIQRQLSLQKMKWYRWCVDNDLLLNEKEVNNDE